MHTYEHIQTLTHKLIHAHTHAYHAMTPSLSTHTRAPPRPSHLFCVTYCLHQLLYRHGLLEGKIVALCGQATHVYEDIGISCKGDAASKRFRYLFLMHSRLPREAWMLCTAPFLLDMLLAMHAVKPTMFAPCRKAHKLKCMKHSPQPAPVIPATEQAMCSSSLYIFSLRTPTALESRSCSGAAPAR